VRKTRGPQRSQRGISRHLETTKSSERKTSVALKRGPFDESGENTGKQHDPVRMWFAALAGMSKPGDRPQLSMWRDAVRAISGADVSHEAIAHRAYLKHVNGEGSSCPIRNWLDAERELTEIAFPTFVSVEKSDQTAD
jgi:hypothetical protein